MARRLHLMRFREWNITNSDTTLRNVRIVMISVNSLNRTGNYVPPTT